MLPFEGVGLAHSKLWFQHQLFEPEGVFVGLMKAILVVFLHLFSFVSATQQEVG